MPRLSFLTAAMPTPSDKTRNMQWSKQHPRTSFHSRAKSRSAATFPRPSERLLRPTERLLLLFREVSTSTGFSQRRSCFFFFLHTFPKQPWWRAIKKLNMLGAVSGGRIEKYWKSRKGGGDSKREGNYLFSRRDITRRRPCTHRKHLSPARCVQVVTYSASASFVCLMCASTPL